MFVPLREVQGLRGTRSERDRIYDAAQDGLGDIRSELKQEAAAAGRGLIQQAAKYGGKKLAGKGKAGAAPTAAPKKKKGLPPLAWGGIILGGALLVGLAVRGGRGRRAAA